MNRNVRDSGGSRMVPDVIEKIRASYHVCSFPESRRSQPPAPDCCPQINLVKSEDRCCF